MWLHAIPPQPGSPAHQGMNSTTSQHPAGGRDQPARPARQWSILGRPGRTTSQVCSAPGPLEKPMRRFRRGAVLIQRRPGGPTSLEDGEPRSAQRASRPRRCRSSHRCNAESIVEGLQAGAVRRGIPAVPRILRARVFRAGGVVLLTAASWVIPEPRLSCRPLPSLAGHPTVQEKIPDESSNARQAALPRS